VGGLKYEKVRVMSVRIVSFVWLRGEAHLDGEEGSLEGGGGMTPWAPW